MVSTFEAAMESPAAAVPFPIVTIEPRPENATLVPTVLEVPLYKL